MSNEPAPTLRSLVQGLKRQALHARHLGFRHPVNGEWMEFESPLPDDLAEILTYLEAKYRADAQNGSSEES